MGAEMKDRHIITVDGLAGSGKTSISQGLARKLGYAHLNSGSLYRAVGYLVVRTGASPFDVETLGQIIKNNTIALQLADDGSGGTVCLINGIIMGEELRTPEVSEATSQCSSVPLLRSMLVEAQREAFPGQHLVAEGRDMGTVIFPDADLKFFIEVSAETRVMRRVAQLYGDTASLSGDKLLEIKAEMRREILERDDRDQNRFDSPTKPARDAVLVSNDQGTLTEIIQNLYDRAASAGLV
jgi:CMP/dCMP kinase